MRRIGKIVIGCVAVAWLWTAQGDAASKGAQAQQSSNNVTATVVVNPQGEQNQLVIVGNGSNNAIAIVDLGNYRWVVGLQGTTVNGQTAAHFSNTDLPETSIAMGDGDDTVIVVGNISGSQFLASGGPGTNDIFAALGNLSISGGAQITGFEQVYPSDLQQP